MEQTNLKSKNKKPNYLALKIISIIVYLALLCFLVVEFIPIIMQTDIADKKLMVATFIVFTLVIVGGIATIISTVISLIFLIVAILNRKKDRTKAHLIFFTIMTILPLFTEIIFFIMCKLIV